MKMPRGTKVPVASILTTFGLFGVLGPSLALCAQPDGGLQTAACGVSPPFADHSHRAGNLETLRERFAKPPREAGPWVYWFWFDNVVSKTEISRQLEEMAAAGIAGAELRCVVARGFPGLSGLWYSSEGWVKMGHRRLEYLSEEFVDVLEHTCAEANRCGVKLAMNLGMGWPPGGPWITSEHRSKHLQSASRIVTGPKPLRPGEVSVPAGAMVFAWRIDESAEGSQVIPRSFRDLTGNVDAQRRLSWDVPYDLNRLVLLDDIRTMAEATHIANLIADNVNLVCCGVMPESWTVFEDNQDSADARRLLDQFKAAEDQGRVIDAQTDGWKAALFASQTVRWLPTDAKLSYQHRRVDGAEIYFLVNWGDDFRGQVSFPHGDLVPELWDAETGATKPAGQYRCENGRMSVRVSLPHLESLFVVFTERESMLHAVACHDGRIESDSDGSLYAIPTGNRPCRVELSDGKQLALEASVPTPLTISGPWALTAAKNNGFGLETPLEIPLERLLPWRSMPILRRFAGTATYSNQFVLADEFVGGDVQLSLDLGRVHEVAKIWINDRLAGTTWHSPYRLEITDFVRNGTNELRIEVANILKNHLERGSDYARPSGLLGPVQVRPTARILLGSSR